MLMQRAKEEQAIVLDFLKHGYPEDSRSFHQKEPIVQAIGADHFTLFELVPRANIDLKPHDKISVGEGERKEIEYIKGILLVNKLTQTAKSELPFVVEQLVNDNQKRFLDFLNLSGPISLRAHKLELLPGVGKRHAQELLKAREEKLFESFEDVKKRVSSVPDVKKSIIQRILSELNEEDRHRLFVRV